MSSYTVADLLQISQAPHIGPARLRLLVSHFPDPELLFHASARELAAVEGFQRKISSEVAAYFRGAGLDEAKRFADGQLSRINTIGGRIVTYWDRQYPELLKRIFDPPALLFCCGELLPADGYAIAVVGTRLPSPYGAGMTGKLSHEISSHGITVVSGLARGIDTLAHDAALKAGGRTIAVIGSGLDNIYPRENKRLAERIMESGCVISEFNMGAKPDAPNFPRRNRIVSGLAFGTLIVETDLNGGAMITASLALDQNREVFAIPGPINTRKSRGCNLLIKTGRAKLIDSFDDIVQELEAKLRPLLRGQETAAPQPLPQLTLFEQAIHDRLSDTPVHIDRIAEDAGISVSDALVSLLTLEFKNLVKQLPGKMFIRI